MALADCPVVNDSGITYHFGFPKSHGTTETGTLVIMTDAAATVAVNDPCTGTALYYPTPTVPAVISICAGAQYRGAGPDSGYTIGLGRVDAATPLLHVVFKINDAGNNSDDAFLVLPKNPDRRGSAYYSLGHRIDGRWLATADTSMTLNYVELQGLHELYRYTGQPRRR